MRTNPHMTAAAASFQNAARSFEDGMGRICRLYGIQPMVGRLYAVLFLAPEPLALEELAERVSAAKSTVSVAVRKLVSARVVQRLPPRGDRRDYYAVVGDPWEVLAAWNRQYFQPELEMWDGSMAAITQSLRSGRDAPRGQRKAELSARVERLNAFVSVLRRALEAVPTYASAKPARAIPISFEEDP